MDPAAPPSSPSIYAVQSFERAILLFANKADSISRWRRRRATFCATHVRGAKRGWRGISPSPLLINSCGVYQNAELTAVPSKMVRVKFPSRFLSVQRRLLRFSLGCLSWPAAALYRWIMMIASDRLREGNRAWPVLTLGPENS